MHEIWVWDIQHDSVLFEFLYKLHCTQTIKIHELGFNFKFINPQTITFLRLI